MLNVCMSEKVRAICEKYDPNYDTMSLDELYLDITDYLSSNPNETASNVANEIRTQIFKETQLTASAGIACNRMLAKIGSDMNKPNGQFELKSDRNTIIDFMNTLPTRYIS